MTLFVPQWATNLNYSAGPDVGTPTKVDPSSAPNGFIAGVIAAPQHVNFLIAGLSAVLAPAARRAFTIAALHLRELRLEGTTITDTAEALGVVALPSGVIALLKTDVTFWVGDWSRPEALVGVGTSSTIDGNVRDVARRTTDDRLVAIGTDSGVGGGATSFSTTDGATWAPGSNGSGLNPHRIVWSAQADRFVISLADDNNVWLTDDGTATGAAFPSTGLANAEDTNGLAVCDVGTASEQIFICGSLTGAIGRPAFRKSADGGATWSAGTQLPAGVYAGIGCLVGDGGSLAWWCGTLTGGTGINVAVSGTGTVWATVATLSPPAGTTFSTSSNPRILRCPDTGLMVIVAPLTSANGFNALYASIGGSITSSDWFGPKLMGPSVNVNGFAIAGGRLFATRNEMIFASDGVGSE